jgi:hypothetical protein
MSIYNLFFFMNAEERRKKEPGWKIEYSAAILPLTRCMIDCLYNVTSILLKPGEKGLLFRTSGYMMMLKALDSDEERHGSQPKWIEYIAERRKQLPSPCHRTRLHRQPAPPHSS